MERITPEYARELLLAETAPIEEAVDAPLLEALGGVTACAVYAPQDNPPFDRSPLDGFALRSADTAPLRDDPAPVRLAVKTVIYAGDWFDGVVGPGEAAKIMTGAPIPRGADCVIGKEDAREEQTAHGNYAYITKPLARHDNYVFQGEDIPKGSLLFPAGVVLTSAHLGVLASMGLATVRVKRPVRIGLLCTGDEIVPPGAALPKGKIYNSNEILLASRLRELGFEATTLRQTGDDAEAVSRLLAERADDFDVMITTGAVSVGDKDIFHAVFAHLGVRRVFYRLASRPGNAALCGVYKDTPLLCLSGNPFAAILSFELLARPVLAKMSGRPCVDVRRGKAVLDTPFSKEAGMRRFIRAKQAGGRVSMPGGNSSGQLFSFVDCDCFVDVPAETTVLNKGEEVAILDLSFGDGVRPRQAMVSDPA
jgi:molybdopterin molybdotransferase